MLDKFFLINYFFIQWCKMKRNRTSINKITPPALSEVVPRERLFKRLESKQSCRVTWVSGTAGSGKTTLVVGHIAGRKRSCLWYRMDEGDDDLSTFFHYLGLAAKKAAPQKRKLLPTLTPEYYPGVSVFAQRYFEELSLRFSEPAFFVFDDYQKIPPSSTLHDVLKEGLERVSDNIRVFILSRTAPPPVFASLVANHKMNIIASADLYLTLAETQKLIRIEAGEIPARKFASPIYEKTGGWAAGVVLMAKSIRPDSPAHEGSNAVVPSEVFDYFAGELFEKMDEPVKTFLLSTAFLPRMTARMAEELTGLPHADRLLSFLRSNNIFTERIFTTLPTYQYHSLFRDFLISRASDALGRFGVDRIKRRAARLLAASGEIEDAVDLFFQAHDLDGLIPVILSQAESLIAQGRNKTLANWIKKIPADLLDKQPWLLYWLGVACQYFSAAEAKNYLEKAFRLFEADSDLKGLYLSWAGIVDCIAYGWSYFSELDPWLEWFEHRRNEGHCFPLPELEAKATTCLMMASVIRNPGRPDMRHLAEQALSLSRKHGDINLRLQAIDWAMMYFCWIGDFAKTETILDESRQLAKENRTSPVMTIHWKWMDISTRVSTMTDNKTVPAEISETLDLIRRTGLYVWENIFFMPGIFAYLLLDEFDGAAAYLKRFESILDRAHFHGYSTFHHFSGLYNMLKGNLTRALAHAETAVKLADETGYILAAIVCRIQLACILHERGNAQEAGKALNRAQSEAAAAQSNIYRFMCLLLRAKIAFDRGEERRGFEVLKEALSIGSEHRYLNMIWWRQPEMLSQLCTKALAQNMEVDYVQRIITAHRLLPANAWDPIDSWPWPVKIYTFGRFSVLIDGQPLLFEGKAQKRPLELLKAVIAYGGKNVRVDQLIDALWPEADGDRALSSFSTTLNRLRTLLIHKDAVVLQDGEISLNEAYCWVDARAFRRILSGAEEIRPKAGGKKAIDLSEKALSLYKGHFLANDGGRSWIIFARERLKNIFLSTILKNGAWYERNQKYAEAIDGYEKGLAADHLEEVLYRRLMSCHNRLGRHADAAGIYRRCRKTLAAAFGVEPSQETQSLYLKITS